MSPGSRSDTRCRTRRSCRHPTSPQELRFGTPRVHHTVPGKGRPPLDSTEPVMRRAACRRAPFAHLARSGAHTRPGFGRGPVEDRSGPGLLDRLSAFGFGHVAPGFGSRKASTKIDCVGALRRGALPIPRAAEPLRLSQPTEVQRPPAQGGGARQVGRGWLRSGLCANGGLSQSCTDDHRCRVAPSATSRRTRSWTGSPTCASGCRCRRELLEAHCSGAPPNCPTEGAPP